MNDADGRTTDPDSMMQLLRSLQDLMWAHPVAFQRGFSALVREGRAYAETEEGRRLLLRLQRSDLAHRSRLVWDMLSMTAFTDVEGEVLPSAFIDAMAKAAATEGIEALLSHVFLERI